MARIILLSQQVIDRMIADPEFREFACVANPPRAKHAVAQPTPKKCGGCSRKRRSAVRKAATGAIDYNAVKRIIVTLPEQQKEALKERLGCTGVKVQWRDHRSMMQRCVI